MRKFASLLAAVLLLSALALATACEGSGGGDTGGNDTTGGDGSSQADGTAGTDTGTPPTGDVVTPPNCECGARVCGAHPDSANCPSTTCGTCSAGYACDEAFGQCVADACSCSGRECGAHPDAANCATVSCGDCAEGECNASGQCVTDCVKECGTRECGLDPVCELSCGTCAAGDVCNESGMCEACVPECGARECGVDPVCGQSCGTCDPGYNCEGGTCVEPVQAAGFGGFCLESNACHGDITATGDTATPTYPDCLDLMCETGECWGWWCTKACAPEKDEVNNVSGAPVPDGIEDADSTSTQCAGWAEGDAGGYDGPYRCVNLQQPAPGTQPVGYCMPGSDFRACGSNNDCPNGESCQVMLIAGALSTFCLQAPKNAKGIAEECNSNPLEGELGFCETDLCFGVGCTEFCVTDEDCATFTNGCDTTAGTCTDDPQIECASDADCSAWECNEDMKIFSNVDDTFDLCLGRNCFDNGGCHDSDFYCRLFGNFEDGMDPADFKWEPACEGRPAGSVDVGEVCDDDPEDNIEGPVCHSDFCISGHCSAFCTGDEDCATDLGQRCLIYEWPLDLDDDGTDDHSEPLGLCYTIDGVDADSAACRTQADCPDGSTCSVFQAGDYSPGEGGETYMSGVCKPDAEGALGYLEACGLEDTQICKGEGWLYQCFESNPDEGIPGYCSIACGSSADCPAGTFFDGTEVIGVCESLYYGYNGTDEDQTDDLFIAFCSPYDAATSKADCSADFTCEDEFEACLPNQILGGPTDVPVVEWLCLEAFDAENPRPTGQVGDACTDGTDCASLYCHNETDAENAGYCSQFCHTDDDCTADDMTCVQDVWFDRADDQYDMVVPNCQRAAAM